VIRQQSGAARRRFGQRRRIIAVVERVMRAMIGAVVLSVLITGCGASPPVSRTYAGERCVANPAGEKACAARGAAFRYGPVADPPCNGHDPGEAGRRQQERLRIERSRQACSCNNLAEEERHSVECSRAL
jgi:hypothetical protein